MCDIPSTRNDTYKFPRKIFSIVFKRIRFREKYKKITDNVMGNDTGENFPLVKERTRIINTREFNEPIRSILLLVEHFCVGSES